MRNQRIMVYDAMEDMRFDKNLQTIRKEVAQKRGTFVFDPEDFKEDAKSFTVAAYQLPEEGLLEYARQATQLRIMFLNKAIQANKDRTENMTVEELELKEIKINLHRKCKTDIKKEIQQDLSLGFESGFRQTARGKLRKSDLTIN